MAWSASVPHLDPLGTRLQFSPNICQHQDKSGHGTLAGEPLRVDELLRLAARTINICGATFRVEQPSQLRAVLDPFVHLGLEHGKAIQRGDQLYYKIRAQVRKFTLLVPGQLVDTRTKNPGGIRRVRGPARKEVLHTEINSITKSGHRCGNLRFSSLVSLSTRERRTQEASGEYAAPLGRKYSTLESNTRPRPSSCAQFPNCIVSPLLRQLVSAPGGGMIRMSPSDVRSTRKSGMVMQNR